jgi:hypothetical protein
MASLDKAQIQRRPTICLVPAWGANCQYEDLHCVPSLSLPVRWGIPRSGVLKAPLHVRFGIRA